MSVKFWIVIFKNEIRRGVFQNRVRFGVVSAMTRLDDPDGAHPGTRKFFFFQTSNPEYRAFFLRIRRPVREADLASRSAVVKDEWSFTSTPVCLQG